MTVNAQNASAVVGFGAGFYAGPSSAMRGGPVFTAAVLFRPINFTGADQFLFANRNPANFSGWAIGVRGTTDAPILFTELGNGASFQREEIALSPLVAGHLMLVHLVAEAGGRSVYLNAGRLATGGASGGIASALGATVGAREGGADPANGCAVIGTAFLAGTALSPTLIVENFRACHRAYDMARINEVAGPGLLDWTNRFSARFGAVQPGVFGSLPATPPLAASTWTPIEGATSLARNGEVFSDDYTNPVWAGEATANIANVANSYSRTFVDADIVAGILTVNHALGNPLVSVIIRDGAGVRVMPDSDVAVNANNVDVGLASFQPIVGVWTALVIGI